MTVRQLQTLRLRLHRLHPSRPLRDARAAAAFVREQQVVLAAGRSSLPMLAEAIVGVRIRGSWMAHPEVYRIHRILRGLRRYHLASAPLILGKETLLDPELGPAVERLAVDPARREGARRVLPRLARRLLEEIEARGRLRMDRWDAPVREGRRARMLLERQLLVVSREAHTERGYHTAFVVPWARAPFSRRFARPAAALTLDDALDRLLLAAVRAAVVVPEREVRRWLVAGAERVEALVERGALRRLTGPGGPWLCTAARGRAARVRGV